MDGIILESRTWLVIFPSEFLKNLLTGDKMTYFVLVKDIIWGGEITFEN